MTPKTRREKILDLILVKLGAILTRNNIVQAEELTDAILALDEGLQELDEERFKEATMDLIDKHFPKGHCKERGAAIVLYADIIFVLKTFGTKEVKMPDKLKYIKKIRNKILAENNGVDLNLLKPIKLGLDELFDAFEKLNPSLKRENHDK